MKMKLMEEHIYVETGWCDGGGMGYWDGTKESIEVYSDEEAKTLTAEWLKSGKIKYTSWGIKGNFDYGMFRVRKVYTTVIETHNKQDIIDYLEKA